MVLPIGDKSEELQLGLYENAIDSICHAIEHYTSDPVESRRYKYALLHLAQGVVLLLKERLSQVHPNFIYTNVIDNRRTTDVEQTLTRLEKIANVELGANRKLVLDLAEIRNEVEHYAISINKSQAASIILRVMVFADSFVRNELKKDFRSEIGDANWQALVSVKDYLDQLKATITKRLRDEGKEVFLCANCDSYTATLKNWSPEKIDPWELNIYKIVCEVCSQGIAYYEKCRGCGTPMLHRDPAATVWANYCGECMEQLRLRYPTFSHPQFVAEVSRWFQENKTITTEQLLHLLSNVAMFGSSKYSYLQQLIDKGFIDFCYREQCEVYQAGMLPVTVSLSNGVFRWIYDLDFASEQQ